MAGIMSQNAPHSERIANLDLLRLVAAVAVVGFHYLFRGAAAEPYLAEGYPEAGPFAIYGYLGVNLFFLISGFVIAASAEGRSWQAFAVARFARIYPGFIACMTLSAVVLALAGGALMPVTFSQYLANLAIFSPALGEKFVDGVYWSIVLELIFYGWVTLAVAGGIFSRLKLELVAGWLLICAFNEILLGSSAARLLFITDYGPLFAAGILIHHLATRERSAEALVLLAAAFVLSCDNMRLMQQWMLGHYGAALSLPQLIVGNAVIHALLIAAVHLRGEAWSGATVAMLGGLTYPLYLLHQDIGYVAIDALAPFIGKWSAALLVTAAMIVLSFAVWRYIERPARPYLIALFQPLADRAAAIFPARPATA